MDVNAGTWIIKSSLFARFTSHNAEGHVIRTLWGASGPYIVPVCCGFLHYGGRLSVAPGCMCCGWHGPHLMHVLCWFSFGVRLAWIRTGAQREHGWVCYGSGRKRCRLSPGEDLTLEIINENWRDPWAQYDVLFEHDVRVCFYFYWFMMLTRSNGSSCSSKWRE